jgi:hypothetical protein
MKQTYKQDDQNIPPYIKMIMDECRIAEFNLLDEDEEVLN